MKPAKRQQARIMGRNFFHLHLVSDSTGETLITVARAATALYAGISPIEHVYPLVRTARQLDRVINDIENEPGIVLYTMVDTQLAERLHRACEDQGAPAFRFWSRSTTCFNPISVWSPPRRPGRSIP